MSGSSSIDNKAENNLEIQANIFASSLLIPDNFCIKIAKEYFKDKNIYENYIWFDFQPCNQELGH